MPTIMKLNSVKNCSLIWLKLKIKSLRLSRRTGYADEDTVKAVIIKELKTSGQLLGYRAMWRHVCKKYRLNVKR